MGSHNDSIEVIAFRCRFRRHFIETLEAWEMFELILINGCGGAGKDTTGRLLLPKLANAALIDIKALSITNPWKYSDFQIGLKNAAVLINSYAEAGYSQIILTGGVNSQDRLDYLINLLPKSIRIHYFWLDVSKATRDTRRIARSRDEADKAQFLDSVDLVFTDPGDLNIPNAQFERISSERMTQDEVVTTIRKKLSAEG